MRHGIDAYFDEIARFERRLSLIGFSVVVVFVIAGVWARRPEIVEALNDPKRFGFEGPDQYVNRILLEQWGPREQHGTRDESFAPVNMHRGGGRQRSAEQGRRPAPEAKRTGRGIGDDVLDLEARVRALALEGPIIRSEDLVVERLVRPDYPEEARNKDIEGLVEMVALVDTTGAVAEVHIIGGSHDPMLEHAATSAVLQCRYRPYRVKDSVERVWAYYRISFSLY